MPQNNNTIIKDSALFANNRNAQYEIAEPQAAKKLCMRHFRASPVLVGNRPRQKNHGQRLQLEKGLFKKKYFFA